MDVLPTLGEQARRDSVLTFLTLVDEEGLFQAFAGLETRTYIREVTTEQLDETGRVVASENRVFRNHPAKGISGDEDSAQESVRATGGSHAVSLESVSSNGEFTFGTVSELAARAGGDNNATLFFPFRPPGNRGYNESRHQSKYLFQFLPDTLMQGRSLRTVDIRVRDEAAAYVSVQAVRFFIETASLRVIALRIRQRSESMLYHEETTNYLEGRIAENGSLAPFRSEVTSMLRAFFSDPVKLKTVSVFEF